MKWINIGLSILLTVSFAACHPQAQTITKEEESHADNQENVARISTEQLKAVGIVLGKIQYKGLSQTIRANGSLKVPKTNKGYATSLYGGSIVKLHVMPGQNVRKGQLIATLASPEFIQQQEEYLATISKMYYAQEEFNRQQALDSHSAGAKKNLQMAQTELSSLKTRHASLKRQLQLAGISLQQISPNKIQSTLPIYSPINGVVKDVLAQVGSYMTPSSPIAEIIDNSSLHLDLNIYEQDLPKIRIGQTIHFKLTNSPQKEYDAKVYTIGSTFEPDNRTIAVHCKLIGDKRGFVDGMNITGMISLGEELLPTVPDEAIVHADGKDYIFAQSSSQHKHSDVKEFVPIEIIRGVSQLGYTAITPIVEVGKDQQIVLKGAFFVNARLREAESGHEH